MPLYSSQHSKKPRRDQRLNGAARFLRWCRIHDRLAMLLFSALWVAVLYGPSLFGPFLYDDVSLIQQNTALTTLGGMHHFLVHAVPFASDLRPNSGASYRPLLWGVFALERHIWGNNPFGFHLLNLLLHVVNGVLIYSLLQRLRQPKRLAALSCFLWLALPTNAEAVAWISGGTYPICFFFVLCALHCALSYMQQPRPARIAFYTAALLLACFSNEAGVLTIALTLLVIDAYGEIQRRISLVLLTSALCVTGIYLVLRRLAGGYATSGHMALFPVGVSILDYLRLLFFPIRLSVDRSTVTPTNTIDAVSVAALIAIGALIVFALWLRKRIPAAAFGLLWALLCLLPYSGLVPLYQGMAERYLYIASVGFVLAVTAIGSALPARGRRIAFMVALIWICGDAFRLHARVLAWTNPILLYRDSLAATPNSPKLQYNLGAAYEKSGDLDDAANAYRKTLALDPNYAQALAGMGNIDLQSGEAANAEGEYKKAIAIDPTLKLAWKNLGILLLQQARFAEAVPDLKQAISLAPLDPDSHTALGIAYQKTDDTESARQEYRKALGLDPEDATAAHNLQLMDMPN